MSYIRFIGWRYLMAKKRSRFLSIVTMMCIAGVALGVTALIVVISVMEGFKKDLRDKILGAKAHIVVEASDGEYLGSQQEVVALKQRFPSIVGVAPFVEQEVMVSSPTNLGGVILRGVDPGVVGEVSELPENMVEGRGSLAYLRDPSPLVEELDRRRERDRDALRARLGLEESGDEAAEDRVEDEGAREPSPGVMPPMFDEGQDAVGMAPMFDEGGETADEPTVPGLVIGVELAKSLQVEVGDEVNVVTPEGEMGPTGPMPRSRPFRVVGVFKSGMYEYDANHAYTTFEDARDFVGASGASGVELKTVGPEVALEVSGELQRALGEGYKVLDWKELNRSLFFALQLEKIVMFVVLTFIILVASFSIVAMLIMIVIEKAREIAILKSMGVDDAGIMKIFVFQGWVIGSIGAGIGLALGLGICGYLKVYGLPLDFAAMADVYYITKLPVDVRPLEVAVVVVSAMVISLLATIYPSYLAARLRPVEGLRYE